MAGNQITFTLDEFEKPNGDRLFIVVEIIFLIDLIT